MKVRNAGFTLSELLIALAILGVIATFTIPKVLQTQSSSEYNSKAKEVVGMLSEAYQSYKADYGYPTSPAEATHSELMQYINYIRVMSTGQLVDNLYGDPAITWTCAASTKCWLLATGGVIYSRHDNWGVCDAGNPGDVIMWYFDPDGKVTDGTASGPGKAVRFIMQPNGRIFTDKESPNVNLCECGACAGGPNPARVPPWFSWN